MLFEQDFQSLQILDVFLIDQKDVHSSNTGRNFHALSLRLSSDACLKAGSDTYRMSDNSVCFVPTDLDYQRIATRDRMIVIHFHMIGYTQKKIEIFTPVDPTLQTLFQQLLLSWQEKLPGYRYHCHSLLYEIFAICHSQTNRIQRPSKISKGVSYMQSHWSDPALTIGQAANEANMSEVYFRRLFYQQYGMTPKQYMIDLRLQNAVSLMDTGYFTLQEIAAQCGYTDYKYFSVEFKRHKGCCPSEYIHRLKKV